ncbi:Hypothetical protein PHPALM_8911 [Phytophthora palmivora]|uniref:Uncharacterized protein n=1 Tax=Phytophthora palmivora TaxID=4796 RepID=A0A2P4Y912_9STRA|nr:Hypothetical protein PHPALM_8911 [Phytophthora palmivora]
MYTFEKTFQQIWLELTKKGWTYKKTTGLSNGHRYLPPGGNVKGTEGIDYFVGDQWFSDDQAESDHTEAVFEETQEGYDMRMMCFAVTVLTLEFVTNSTVSATTDAPADLQGNTEEAVPELKRLLWTIPNMTKRRYRCLLRLRLSSIMEVGRTAQRVPNTSTGVPLDDFDSNNFLDALRRDRLFAYDGVDDLNVGDDD